MRDVNTICFDPENYNDIYDMWWNIQNFLEIITKNNYIAVIHKEDFGLIYIEYETSNEEFGCKYPVWLTPDQRESIYDEEGVV